MSDDALDKTLADLLWVPELALAEALDTPLSPLQTSSEASSRHQEAWSDLDWLLAVPDTLDVGMPMVEPTPTPTPMLLRPPPWERDERAASPKQRMTVKHRIQLVKDEIARLQRDLETARVQLPKHRTTDGPRALANGASMSQAGQRWQAIAGRQQQRRERAEEDNKRLRVLVLAQRRHLLSLRRLLGRRPHRKEAEAETDQWLAANSLRCMPFQADREFLLLLKQLDEQYARVDHLMAEARMCELPCPGRRCLTSTQTVREETRFGYIDRVDLPFELKSVERAVWESLADPRLRYPTAEYTKLVGDREDTVQLSMKLIKHFSGNKVMNSRRVVTRKFVERGRVVFVTQSLNAPCVIGDIATVGIQFLSTTIRVLRPGGLLSTGGNSTVIESLWIAHGLDGDGISKCPAWKVEPYIDVGLRALDLVLTHEHKVLEDLLMERVSA